MKYDSLSSKSDGNRLSSIQSSNQIHHTLSGPDYIPSGSLVESGATSDYAFSGFISEQVLHNYLDKAITMQGMCSWYNDESIRMQDINMIIDVGAKFVGRAHGFWGDVNDLWIDYVCDKLQLAISTVHAVEPRCIL